MTNHSSPLGAVVTKDICKIPQFEPAAKPETCASPMTGGA
jgi:hypothetical protein